MALTRSQLMRIKENRRYWREREANQREAYIRTEDAELAEINKIYSDMYRWAEREVNAFYGKYADAEGIDITEAKRRVKELDIAEYEKLAKDYVKDKDFSPQANAEMRLYNATMRINRMELLKAQIGLKLVDGINDIDKHWEKIATDRATQEIIRQSGILGKTLTDTETARTAKQIVNADFYNATFSQRIWSHMDNLKSDIAIELQKGFIAGVSSREMARRLKEHCFDKSEKDAFRLARTELRRIQTDVAKDNYERNGITQYEYMAVNPSACPICRELDGRIFDVARMKAGLNAPPIHPNCHCTTAPHIDTDEYEQWLSWLERGGTTKQWDMMTPAERAKWYGTLSDPLKVDLKTPTTTEQETNDLEDEAIEWYVSGEGMWINQYLRGRMDADLMDGEKELLNALEKATNNPLPKGFNNGKLWRSVDASAIFSGMGELELSQLSDHILYGDSVYSKGAYSQGIKSRMEKAIDDVEGKTITELGFMSTTKSKGVAEEWGYFTDATVPMVIEFDTTKASIKGKEIDQKFEIDDEPQQEVLLHPKTKYKVLSIEAGYSEEAGKFIKVNAEFTN